MTKLSPDQIAQILMTTANAHGAELVALSFETSQAACAAGLHSYRAVRNHVFSRQIAETIALVPQATQ